MKLINEILFGEKELNGHLIENFMYIYVEP